MPSKTNPESAIVSAAELSWLLAHHKITPVPGTVFEEAARIDPDSGVRARLVKSIFLNDELGIALREAIKTDPQIRVRDAALDAIGTGLYFDGMGISRQPAGLLVWKRPTGDYLLTFPVDAAQVLQRASEMLDPVESAPPPAFEGLFSRATLTALVAAIDYLRTLFAASLLERQGLSGVLLRRSDIETQVSSGHAHKDYRSLIALFNAFVPSLIPTEPDDLDEGIEELIEVGLLIKTDASLNGWLPAPELMAMALNLLIPLPALSLLTEMSHAGQNNAVPHQLIALRGNSLWLLNILAGSEGSPDGVRIRGVDGLTLMIEIQGFLEAAKISAQVMAEALAETKSARSVADTEAPKQFCTACGKQLKPGVKFCPNCGTKIQAS